MAKIYCKIWMPLSDYTARHLPFPEGPLRAGERLGEDRRPTVLHGRHLDGDIKIRKCNGNCAPCTDECEVKPGDWFRAEYALSLLVGKGWEPIGPVEVLAYDLIEEPACDPADAPAIVEGAAEEPPQRGPEVPPQRAAQAADGERPGDAPVLADLAALFETLGLTKEEPARLEAVKAEIKFTRRQWRIAWSRNPPGNKIKPGYHQ
jgi:hypothetical protein